MWRLSILKAETFHHLCNLYGKVCCQCESDWWTVNGKAYEIFYGMIFQTWMWHELLRLCLVCLRYVWVPGVFTELTVTICIVFCCTFLHFVNTRVLSFYIKVIKHIIMLRLVYSHMKHPPKLIQAKTRRRNTMDTLYFCELVERSENTTQQESGECICSCRSWKSCFFAITKKIVMQNVWGRVAHVTVCIFADEGKSQDFFLLEYLLFERWQ